MIYDNYQKVPEGVMCRPQAQGDWDFHSKEDWMGRKLYAGDTVSLSSILGKWESQDKTITITEGEFDAVVTRTLGLMRQEDDDAFLLDVLRKELFK